MSSSKKAPKPPKMPDPKELIALQAEYNRVNVDTPFGKQTYVPGPGGSTTLKTDIGPMGQALVGRGVSLGMTDSARQSVDPRMNELAGALLGRVGDRFGMDLGGALQLSPDAAMPQQMQKPAPQPQQPVPQLPTMGGGAPGMGGASYGGSTGYGYGTTPGANFSPQMPGVTLEELMKAGLK